MLLSRVVLLSLLASLLVACDKHNDLDAMKLNPLYADQWHLNNDGSNGSVAGEDINVEPVWLEYLGSGVRIAIVDDGLEIAHEDLKDNIAAGESYDYWDGDTDPTAGAHGTSVAGVAAARGDNEKGVVGVAPDAELVGYAVLDSLTSSTQADAMTRGKESNSISSNSWGAPDGTGIMYTDPLSDASLWQQAIDIGVSQGRSGKGVIYTWAAGNGYPVDNSNYDGQANYYGTFAIAAVKDDGVRSSYSEEGANILVSTPGGEFCSTNTITTVDRTGLRGWNSGSTQYGMTNVYDYADANYTKCFNGTSAAAPIASGAIALILDANPALSWRDVRIILARSARKNDSNDGDWTDNGAGLSVNHKYGFGVIDAKAAIALAEEWNSVGGSSSMKTHDASSGTLDTALPNNDAVGISHTISVASSGISSIEFVDVTVTSDYPYAGDLQIILTSPSGTSNVLAATHVCAGDCGAGFSNGWRFGIERLLDEKADGDWTLKVADNHELDTGVLNSWSLRIYGR